MIAIAVLAAGALGAVIRFVVDTAVHTRWRPRLPWAVIGINISGSFAAGLIAGAVMFHSASVDWQTVLVTGFCGGYTTFSTTSFDAVRLAQQRRHAAALVNVAVTLGFSVMMCAAGVAIAHAL